MQDANSSDAMSDAAQNDGGQDATADAAACYPLFHACTSFFRKVDPIGLTTRSMIATGLLLDVLLLIYALTGTGSWQMDGGHMWVFAVWSHALGLLCWRSLVVSGTLGVLHHFVLVLRLPPGAAWNIFIAAFRFGRDSSSLSASQRSTTTRNRARASRS